MEIKGYLIQNEEGSYLSHRYDWFAHEKFEDAWVHTENKLEGILLQSPSWELKPARVTRAIYNTERKKSTILVSDPINIQGLDIKQVRDALKKSL